MKIKNVSKLTFLKVTGIALSIGLALNITNTINNIDKRISDSDSTAVRVITVVHDSVVVREYLGVRDSLVIVRDTLLIQPHDSTSWEIYGAGPRITQ